MKEVILCTGVRGSDINGTTYPTVSIVFFYKLAIVVVVEGWVPLHPLLLAHVMVLSFGAVHSSIHNLNSNKSSSVRVLMQRVYAFTAHIYVKSDLITESNYRISEQQSGPILALFEIKPLACNIIYSVVLFQRYLLMFNILLVLPKMSFTVKSEYFYRLTSKENKQSKNDFRCSGNLKAQNAVLNSSSLLLCSFHCG